MKTAPTLLPLLAFLAACALFPAPAHAWSLFGSSPEKKLLEQADAAFEQANEAAERGDSLAEIEALYSARSAYQSLADKHPSYRADHVAQRLDASAMLISTVSAALESGASTIPDPAAGEGRLSEPGAPRAAPDAADPNAPAFRTPIPVLVQTGSNEGAAPPQPPEPAVEEDPALSAAIPNPFFSKAEAAADPPAAADGPAEPPEAAAASVEVTIREAAPPAAVSEEEDVRDARAFLDMLREARATDAVLRLEDRIEEEGDAATLRTRIMYVRALVQCANYRRAADVLAALPKEAEGDPSVRSLRAAVAVGTDNLPEALLQLSLLLRDHPSFADAYVDLAYVYLLLDPVGNRTIAIANYKAGLEHGAKRDGRLEAALEVTIAR